MKSANIFSELGIGIATSIFGLALNTFEKRTLQMPMTEFNPNFVLQNVM